MGSKKTHRFTRIKTLQGGILEIPLDPAGEEDTMSRHGDGDAPEAWLKKIRFVGGGVFCPNDLGFPIRL